MALVPQLLVLPRVQCSSSSSLASSVHVGCDLNHFLLRKPRNGIVGPQRKQLLVSAVSLYTVEEDAETGGGDRRDSRLSQGRFLPSRERGDGYPRNSESSFQGRGGGGRNGGSRDGGRGRGRGRDDSDYASSSQRNYGGERDYAGSNSRGGRSFGSSRGGDDFSSRDSSRGRGDFGSRDSFTGRGDFSSRGGSYRGRGDFSSRGGSSRGRGDFSSRGGSSRGRGDFSSRGGSSRGRGDFSSRGGRDFDRRNDSKSTPRFNTGRVDRYGNALVNRGGSGGRNGRGRGRSSEQNNHRFSSSGSLTITPREVPGKFMSERTVHRAPWDQGTRDDSRSHRDFTRENPLIDRLQGMEDNGDFDFEEEEDTDNDDFVDDDEPDSETRRDLDEDDHAFNLDGEKSAMARIVEKLSSIPGTRSVYAPRNLQSFGEGRDSVFVPQYSKDLFPNVGRGWGTPDHPVAAAAATSQAKKVRPDTRFPWEREDSKLAEEETPEKYTRVKPPSLAELTVPEDELRRLRSLGILARHRVKVGKLGVTSGIVESIHNEWRNSEVVRVKCEGPPAQNMRRTHDLLEEKTGGLVVWRAGGACLVYRGKDYVPPPVKGMLEVQNPEDGTESPTADEVGDGEEKGNEEDPPKPKVRVGRVNSFYDPELEKELEDILAGLGPRYEDWAGGKPVPVDADRILHPDFIFEKPYRLLPYGVRPSLSNVEMTNLRRLGRPIPPHFVLGSNRNLDGLAAAIVKLWEKSEIAKISVKRGVQNTNHERMGEALKRLTGGIILSRDKFFIVIYRGKDFLPPSVSAALEERRTLTKSLQEEEERMRSLPVNRQPIETTVEKAIAGTLAETLEAQANWKSQQNSVERIKIRAEVEKAARTALARRLERKMTITMAKKARAEMEMAKVEKRLRPAGPPVDRENITAEERHMYSKLGLKMHAYLLLGRRGVFDGTVENMHLHWKHRELVKVLYKAKDKIDLEQTARMLEYESGGILVATIPTSKGQAILVYRGKNYQRPPELRPKTLLTKRQALKSSIERQRQKALAKHLLALEKEIEFMKADLSKLGPIDKSFETSSTDSGDMEDDEELDMEDDKELDMEDDEELDMEDDEELDSEDDEDLLDAVTMIEKGFDLPEEVAGDGSAGYLSKRGKLDDEIFRADPLSRKEKLALRQVALKTRKAAAHFNVGRSNVVAGLARAIRIHFQKHALVKVGVNGRARGTPVEEIVFQLEELTGGTLVSREKSKIILYRGWPEGQGKPTDGNGFWEELPPELRSAMMAEAEADEDYLHESDWEESEGEDDVDEDGDNHHDLDTRDSVGTESGDDSDWEEDFEYSSEGEDSDLELGEDEFEDSSSPSETVARDASDYSVEGSTVF